MKNFINTNQSVHLAQYISLVLITMLLLLLAISPARGQSGVSFTIRGGVNYPCHGQNDLNLHNGYGFEGIVGYRVLPQFTLNAGWGYNTFEVESTMGSSEMDFVANGYSLGLQFDQPIASSRFSVLIGGGGIYHHLEVENDAGDVLGDSGHGLGYQVDLGLGIRVGSKLMFTPGIKYRSIERDFDLGEENMRIDLNYLSAGASLGWMF